MSRRCSLTGVGRMVGNQISHSQRKTKRVFLPNLSLTTFVSESLGKLRLKVCQRVKRTIFNKYASIDDYLLNVRASHLTDEALVLRRKIKKILIKK
jgi:large subunit ribosomal protein L28